MTEKEQEQWRDSMIEALYPTLSDRIRKELKVEVVKLVALHVGKWMDITLTVKQVAQILGVKFRTVYKWHERGILTLDKRGKMQYTITLKSLNIQLSGRKELTMEMLGNNKSSKAKSGDSAGEAISED